MSTPRTPRCEFFRPPFDGSACALGTGLLLESYHNPAVGRAAILFRPPADTDGGRLLAVAEARPADRASALAFAAWCEANGCAWLGADIRAEVLRFPLDRVLTRTHYFPALVSGSESGALREAVAVIPQRVIPAVPHRGQWLRVKRVPTAKRAEWRVTLLGSAGADGDGLPPEFDVLPILTALMKGGGQ